MNETKFADSGEEESLGRFAQYIDYPKEMPFPNMRFECGGPAIRCESRNHLNARGNQSLSGVLLVGLETGLHAARITMAAPR